MTLFKEILAFTFTSSASRIVSLAATTDHHYNPRKASVLLTLITRLHSDFEYLLLSVSFLEMHTRNFAPANLSQRETAWAHNPRANNLRHAIRFRKSQLSHVSPELSFHDFKFAEDLRARGKSSQLCTACVIR